MVRGLPRLDDNPRVRHRRTRDEKQSRNMLGSAGRFVCAADRKCRNYSVRTRSIQERVDPRTGCARRQFSGRAKAHEAVWLFAFQSRCDGCDLPASLNSAGQSVEVRNVRWPWHAKGTRIHGALHSEQVELAASSRCDVREGMADASLRVVVWWTRIRSIGSSGRLEDTSGGFGCG